jgi:8-oxo-dGTP pyrophosphatase MutT (NUDIX family)
MIQHTLLDTEYPKTSITHTRAIARAFVMNDKGLFAFNHILFDDKFGHRDYLETAGGGLEQDETVEQAVIREVEEELGYQSEILSFLGVVEDDYHLIQRHNLQYFYLVKVTKQTQSSWTPLEHKMIHAIEWLTLEQARVRYASLSDHGIARLIKQRELPFIDALLTQTLSKIKLNHR